MIIIKLIFTNFSSLLELIKKNICQIPKSTLIKIREKMCQILKLKFKIKKKKKKRSNIFKP